MFTAIVVTRTLLTLILSSKITQKSVLLGVKNIKQAS